ncbi:MAG: hypothetical protein IKU39_06890 [Lachnospiraceae bacterium]|nr:hypothetical protein [Lachnospiraceae bacterium]
MARITITNQFDPSLQMQVDDSRKFDLGSTTDFTDNKMISVIKKTVANMVPEAQLRASTSFESWSRVFCYTLGFKVFYKGINDNEEGFKIKVEFSKCQNCDKYKIGFETPVVKRGWVDMLLPNKAKAYRTKANYAMSSDQYLTFYDPSEETIKGFINAMITPNRRKALQEFINTAKKDAMESANTKNLLDIETMDIIPELERISSKYSMGIPEIVEEAYCRKVVFINGEYGTKFYLNLFKEYMEFNITRGADYVGNNKFDANFIRMLKSFIDQSNIDIATHIPYDKKEQVYDMLTRIGTIYQKTRFLVNYESWYNLDPMWKRNPDRSV